MWNDIYMFTLFIRIFFFLIMQDNLLTNTSLLTSISFWIWKVPFRQIPPTNLWPPPSTNPGPWSILPVHLMMMLNWIWNASKLEQVRSGWCFCLLEREKQREKDREKRVREREESRGYDLLYMLMCLIV